jgi:hypothetical protein
LCRTLAGVELSEIARDPTDRLVKILPAELPLLVSATGSYIERVIGTLACRWRTIRDGKTLTAAFVLPFLEVRGPRLSSLVSWVRDAVRTSEDHGLGRSWLGAVRFVTALKDLDDAGRRLLGVDPVSWTVAGFSG